jgi:hypothetical protein
MEKMEGKTESLEMVNKNNKWLIIEFLFSLKLSVYNIMFFGEGTRWKRWRVKQSPWKW